MTTEGQRPRVKQSAFAVCGSVVLAGICVWACVAVGGAQDEVVCQLTVGKSSHIVGEPVIVKIEVSNHGERKRTVFKPELINHDAAKLVIEGPDGEVLPYVGVRRHGFLPQVVSLGSGQSVAVEVNIRDYYAVANRGTYTVYAICRLPGREKQIRSNKIVFKVREPNGKFSTQLSVESLLSDGSGGETMVWRVFTHREDGVVGVYCCRPWLRDKDGKVRHNPTIFARLGPTPSENDILCLGDTDGKLHVLYRPDEQHYAHAVVSRLGEVEGVDLYKPQKGGRPILVTKVHVENGEKVER